ncbi:hypothetical protein [Hymenobacter sp. AT01-02]|uniref:hypothetical protein n=1 Tax=Hymenobacter sp. AT01-02 TaxID=1571877 RepID=UPI0006E1EF3B|nr:hypothetical protein [Hymenobacter sp. AT01-02]
MMKARINEREIHYQIDGEVQVPDDRVLLASSLDLTAGTAWADAGYVVAPFLAAPEQERLRAGLEELVREAVRATGLPVPAHAPMTAYHHLIGDDQARHLAWCSSLKKFSRCACPYRSRQ